jgi:GrpB-like predicted nucleotidyltransferase (UPF0157 family)
VAERRDPITIVAYDDDWPAAFDRQRSRVEDAQDRPRYRAGKAPFIEEVLKRLGHLA